MYSQLRDEQTQSFPDKCQDFDSLSRLYYYYSYYTEAEVEAFSGECGHGLNNIYYYYFYYYYYYCQQ